MLIVVAGTGTEVGKTWFTAHTIQCLGRSGASVMARKLVQSFDPVDPTPTDAEVLARASGEEPERVCRPHRWLPIAMAPPMAVAALGRDQFTVQELVDEAELASVPQSTTFVESVGGVRSPLAADGDTVTLCHALRPEFVVVVADAGLGAINGARLAASALDAFPVVIALNRYDENDTIHRANKAWLSDTDNFTVVTSPTELADLISNLRDFSVL